MKSRELLQGIKMEKNKGKEVSEEVKKASKDQKEDSRNFEKGP